MLTKVVIAGFKSIEHQVVRLGPVNVMVGANGAGKSNLLSWVRMLASLGSGHLQYFTGASGGASSMLYNGPKRTREIGSGLEFTESGDAFWYEFKLGFAEGDRLFFSDERVYDLNKSADHLGAGHLESGLSEAASRDPAARRVSELLQHVKVFHFLDTSPESGMRAHCDVDTGQYLQARGQNLAAFLFRLRAERPPYYERIRSTIQQVAPFFDDFVLKPTPADKILLRWRSKHAEYEFGPHHLSDGTLRFMALTALLLQPEDEMPALIAVDEPELGLHPLAIDIVCSTVLAAATQGRQFILATQSTAVLDHFDPEDVVVVEQQDGSSIFRRPAEESQDALKTWLSEYSLSELWEKNVIGGRPRP